MSQEVRRATKVQEFPAHTANVNCASMGHKSGRVFVTGGGDKRVNLWAVGKPNCIMSLSGHATPVDCVQFSRTEEQLCAGSEAGVLKIWDLETSRILRTLTGHRSSIRCVDFHPFGEFLASGSSDSSIKMWDVRQKGCIFGYNGHTSAVHTLKFSPDGQWIASGGQDKYIKIWDIRVGRLLGEFGEHTGAVTGVDFHPHEFVLASGSLDRTVKFWDLETFKMISSSEADVPPIRCIKFHPKDNCLFAASTDILRVHGWEPPETFDTVPTGWSRIQDVSVSQDKLVGVTAQLTNVSIFVVDLKRVHPVGSSTVTSRADLSSGLSLRKKFNTERSAESMSAMKAGTDLDNLPTDPEDEEVDVPVQEVFAPQRVLNRTPPPTNFIPDDDPFPPIRDLDRTSPPRNPIPDDVASIRDSDRTPPPRNPIPDDDPSIRNSDQTPPPRNLIPDDEPSLTTSTEKESPKPDVCLPACAGVVDFVPMPTDKPAGVSIDDFLPKKSTAATGYPSEVRAINVTEEDVFPKLSLEHQPILLVLATRQRNLRMILNVWQSKDVKTAVEAAVNLNDISVVVDLLGVLVLRPSIWSLDLCVALLPSILQLLQSRYEAHLTAACNALRLILKNFAFMIKTNIESPIQTVGVDLSREERYNKSMECYQHLVAIRAFTLKNQTFPGKVGHTLRELHVQLSSLG